MLVSELFKQEKKFTGVRQGSWLKHVDGDMVGTIAYLGHEKYQFITWYLEGCDPTQAYWWTNPIIISHTYNRTRAFSKENLQQLLGGSNFDKWEIISNEEAAQYLSKLPTRSL